MSIPMILALLFGVTGLFGETGSTAPDERGVELRPGEPRPYHEIHADVNAFIRRAALAETRADEVAAVLDICLLFEELKRDPRLADSPALQGYRNKLWRRLISVQEDVEQELSRRERLERRHHSDAELLTIEKADQTATSLVQQMQILGYAHGGPARLFAQANGAFGGGTLGDYGPDLVRLIQSTISPEFWDVNGGPGSIVYYRPLLALVVRATSEIHGDIGGALDALPRAGGRWDRGWDCGVLSEREAIEWPAGRRPACGTSPGHLISPRRKRHNRRHPNETRCQQKGFIE